MFHLQNKTIFILALLSLFTTANSFSQTYTQIIRGIITDVDSKAPLIGANIIVLNSNPLIGNVTDIDGKYRLENVPVGRHSIKISMLGYEELILNNIVVTSGKEVVLPVEMHEKVYNTNEVEIVVEKDKTKSNNELTTNSARSFQSEETNRYAGSRGDPSRMAANYAGVATGNDVRNDIIVRGNSPLGVLWRLEGVDIPNPNHFSTQGATGGPISMLNNNLLASSDFLTGAFPAEYGNATGAVFDLKLRNGNNEKHEYTGQVGINGLELGAEGPISKKNGSSFIANYRYSTLEVFQKLGINLGVSSTPRYQDFSFKVFIPAGKRGVFSLWGLGGLSKIEILDSKKNSKDWSFTSTGEDLVFGSSTGVIGVSHLYFFNNTISGKFSASVSSSQLSVIVDTLSQANPTPFRTYTNKSLEGKYNINYTVTDKINSRNVIKIGATYNGLFFDYNESFYSSQQKIYIDRMQIKNNTAIVQAFVHWQYRITDKLTLNNGVHYQNFVYNNSQTVEPRSGLKWQFRPKQSLSMAFGVHGQTQPLSYYYFRSYDKNTGAYIQTNKDLDFTKSNHYIMGYDFSIQKNFRLKLETYYQSLYKIPVREYESSSFSMMNIGNDLNGIPLVDSLYNKGIGKTYGAEFTLEKFFSKNYYFLLTTSLYESKYKGSDGIERYSAFSGGYVLNALGGIEIPLGKNNNKVLAFDEKITYAGGNRYTPIDLSASQLNKEAVYIDALAFSQKYKDYSRIDFKISYKINKKKTTQSWFVNVENILNTKNILRQVYNPQTGSVGTEYQLGIFPYAGYRIEF